MNDNDFEILAGCYTEYSQEFIDHIKQKDFKINYDIELDGGKAMGNMKHLIDDKESSELANIILDFVIKHRLTKNNVWEVFNDVTDFMDDNATLEMDVI